MKKTAFITGATGQDGAYLSALLLQKGYHVAGLSRHVADGDTWRLKELGINAEIELIAGSVDDAQCIDTIIQTHKPDEVYNFAAQSVSGNASWQIPEETMHINLLGTLHILESLRKHAPEARMFQASSSEMYGTAESGNTVDEETPFHPQNPYAISKLAAHHLVASYREKDIFACSGILFNHESPLRGEAYVTRKIAQGVAQIHLKKSDTIALGNLDSKRDWGFAGDYVEAIWKMLQQDTAEDVVIASGNTHSVRDVLDAAFTTIGITDWSSYVIQDPNFVRRTELPPLCGNITKAKDRLDWLPRTSFEEMIRLMLETELTRQQS